MMWRLFLKGSDIEYRCPPATVCRIAMVGETWGSGGYWSPTGEILCMVSAPSYDPTMLVGRQRGENYQKLVKG